MVSSRFSVIFVPVLPACAGAKLIEADGTRRPTHANHPNLLTATCPAGVAGSAESRTEEHSVVLVAGERLKLTAQLSSHDRAVVPIVVSMRIARGTGAAGGRENP